VTASNEIETWAREHEAAWEVAPLFEVVKGEGRRQTGFEIRIYVQTERVSESDLEAVQSRAREIAATVVPRDDTALEFEVGSYDAGQYERRETGYASEIVVPIQATFDDAERQASPAVIAQILAGIEERLGGLGLKPKAWDSQR
jgi:hypothetical protein